MDGGSTVFCPTAQYASDLTNVPSLLKVRAQLAASATNTLFSHITANIPPFPDL